MTKADVRRFARFAAGLIFLAALGGCAAVAPTLPKAASPNPAPGMGRMGGMMDRHNAAIPAEYANVKNTAAADPASIARGETTYTSTCASCHGDGALGDGPASAGLNPAPASIAHTSQMMSDAYLFWRVSEGGAQFQTAMPAWKGALDERTRWDVINYVRALGNGTAAPKRAVGGATGNAADAEARMLADTLAQAVKDGLISQAEADLFQEVHPVLDAYAHAAQSGSGDPVQRQAQLLAELTASGKLTQAKADGFLAVLQRLRAAGKL